MASEVYPFSPASCRCPRLLHDLIVPSKAEEIHPAFRSCSGAFVLHFTADDLPWLDNGIDDSEMRNGTCAIPTACSLDRKTVDLSLVARNALNGRVKTAAACRSVFLPYCIDDTNIVRIVCRSSGEAVEASGCGVHAFWPVHVNTTIRRHKPVGFPPGRRLRSLRVSMV